MTSADLRSGAAPDSSSGAAPALFDGYANHYDLALQKGLAISGESKTYFARGRIARLAALLRGLGVKPRSVLEFGCGNGSSTPLFFELLDVDSVVGVDVSRELLEVAQRTQVRGRASFVLLEDYRARGTEELVFCNGVFHHIRPAERQVICAQIHEALAPGGYFSFWENNPWNPGTQYVMSRIPFDRDAIKLSPREATGLLEASGFRVLRTDSLFFFPKALRLLRWMEPSLRRVPLGAQYGILCQKTR